MSDKKGLLILASAFAGFFLVLLIVFKVLDTEFFRGDPEQGGSASPVRDGKTDTALAHCLDQAALELKLNRDTLPPPPDYTAWNLGFGRYLVKASVAGTGGSRTFLCKIAEPDGAGRWAIQSLDFVN